MSSAIDPTKPADGIPAVKLDLRNNLAAAKSEIEALQSGKADVGHQHLLGDIIDAGALAGLHQVDTGEITDGAITTAKIADAAVIQNKIAGGAVAESKIANAAITQSKIAGGAVTEGKIADAAITQSKIADAAVVQSKIADAAVTQSKIAAGAVGANQLQDGIPINMQDQLLTRAQLKAYSETSTTPSISAGALTLDLASGNVFEVTMTENVASLIFANAPASGRAGSCTLVIKQDGTGGRTLAWPAELRWPGGVPVDISSAANAVDVFAFVTRNGGAIWYGFLGGKAFS